MIKRLKAFLSIGALILAVTDSDKNSARAGECADHLQDRVALDRTAQDSFVQPEAGRFSELVRTMNENDSVALKLNFVAARSLYSYAKQKLGEHHAHFIQEGLADFQPMRSFWRSPKLNPFGMGRLDVRVTKKELSELQRFIELADDIQVERVTGSEDEDHIMRGGRLIVERIVGSELGYWQWVTQRPEKVVRIQTVTSYDRKKFDALAMKIANDDNGVSVARSYYDPLLSIGYMVLQAKVKDLAHVVESTPEIHLVHVTQVDEG